MTAIDIGWLEILYWYLAVGTILTGITYTNKLLADAAAPKKKVSGQWLTFPALSKREELYRFLEPFIAFVVCVSIWPIYVLIMVNQKLFTERLPELAEFKLTPEHLREVLTVESLESENRVFDPLGAVPDVPFGHLNPAWEKLKVSMQAGDTIQRFAAPWGEYGVMWVRSGYAVVHGKDVVYFWVTKEARQAAVQPNESVEGLPT